MNKPIPSTHGVYIPGVGITITRANIEDEQWRRRENKQQAATAEEIVEGFTCTSLQGNNNYKKSFKYQKLVTRATQLMSKQRAPKVKRS